MRLRAGLTQVELADAVGVTQKTVAMWEWSESPPRSKELPAVAKALGVRLDDVIHRGDGGELSPRPGPIGEVQRVFEEVRQLPRRQQRKILEMVTAVVDQYKRTSKDKPSRRSA